MQVAELDSLLFLDSEPHHNDDCSTLEQILDSEEPSLEFGYSDQTMTIPEPTPFSFSEPHYSLFDDVFFTPGMETLEPRYLPDWTEFFTNQQGHVLVECYIQSYHPLAPLLHTPTFLTQCSSILQNNYTHPSDKSRREELGLFLAACFAGCLVCSPEKFALYFPNQQKANLVNDLCKASMRLIRSAGFPRKPTLSTLTAYVICQSSWLRDMIIDPSSLLCLVTPLMKSQRTNP
jgi:hypothetical protein